MKSWLSREEGGTWSFRGRETGSEAGDSLIEVLIALTVISLTAVALLLAFGTSISGSGEEGQLATLDTALRTASAEVTSFMQQQPSSNFANCSGASQYSTPGSISLPSGYSAQITQVAYWNGSGFTAAQPPSTSCPPGALPNSPQQLTILVSHHGTSSTITTVVDDPASPTPSSTCQYPAHQLVWLQQPSSGPTGAALFPTPTIAVEDKTGCIVQSDASQVTLAITSGTGAAGATLDNCVPSLNYGDTIFSNCSIGLPGQNYTLTASDPTDGLTSAQSSPFTITASVPAKLVMKQQPGGGTGGTAWTPGNQPTVWIEDAQGNVITSDQSAVSLAIGTNPGNGTLSGCSSTNAVNGVATFAGCAIDKAANGYTLNATDAADNLTVPVTSNAFNIAVGPPAQLAFTTQPGAAIGGDPFGTQPVVVVEDAGGNTVTTNTSGVALAIGTNPSGGTLTGCSSTTTAGVATFTGCTINRNGNGYTLVASDGALRSTTSTPFNVATAVLSSFSVTPSTNTPTAGAAFNVTVTALDQSGTTFTNFSGSQGLSWSGPANSPNNTAPSYPASVTFTNGAATALVTLTDAQSTTLTVTQGGVSGTSPNFTVKGTATPVGYALSTPSPTAGVAFSETVTAIDTYGNTATGFNGAKGVSWSGPANSPTNTAPSYPGSITFSSGVAPATITLSDAQSTTLKATLGALSGTSAGFTVLPGAPASFTVPNPGTQTAGTAFAVSLTAHDVDGNTATGFSGSQGLSWSGPANSPNNTAPSYPASVTFTNGAATALVTLTDAQSTTLTVAQGGVSGTSPSFTVSAVATPAGITVANPGTQTAGTAFSVGLTAIDTYGNTVTNFNGAKSVSWSGPANSPNNTAPSYPASVTFTNGAATALVTLTDAQSTTLTVTQGGVSGTSPNFTVKGTATPVGYALSTPSPTAGVAFSETVTAIDTYGNTATGFNGAKGVSWSGPANSPTNTAPSYPGSITFSSGVAPATITLSDAQSTTLKATLGALSGTSAGFTVLPGAPASFTVPNPGTQTAGTAFAVSLTAHDVDGNTATGFSGSQGLSWSGPANSPNNTAPSYPASVTFTNGAATALVTLTDAQSTTLTVAQGGVSGTSPSFTVSAVATPAGITVANPGTQTAGTAFSVGLTAIDTYGNTVTNFNGAKSVSWSGPANSPNNTAPSYPASVTFTNGAATALVTLTDAQSTTLTVTQGGVSGTSPNFTVKGTATPVGYALSTPSPTAGVAFSETVTAIDTYGNTATGFNGAKGVSWSGPANSPTNTAPSYPGSITFSSGVAPATITLSDAQSTTLKATLGALSGTSAGFTVLPGAPASFTVPNPGTQTAGTAFAVSLTAHDVDGNTATGFSGSQGLSWSGPANSPNNTAPSYPASVTFTNGAATALVTLTDAQSTTLTVAQGGVSGTSPSFTVSAVATPAGIGLTTVTQPTPTLDCAGAVGAITCSSSGEGSDTGSSNAGLRRAIGSFQLQDGYGNAVTNTGTSLTIAITSSGQGTESPATLSIAHGASTSSTQFTLTRNQGTSNTVTMNAAVGGTTELTITLSS